MENEGMDLEIIVNPKVNDDGQAVVQVINVTKAPNCRYGNLCSLMFHSLKPPLGLQSSTSKAHMASTCRGHGSYQWNLVLISCSSRVTSTRCNTVSLSSTSRGCSRLHPLSNLVITSRRLLNSRRGSRRSLRLSSWITWLLLVMFTSAGMSLFVEPLSVRYFSVSIASPMVLITTCSCRQRGTIDPHSWRLCSREQIALRKLEHDWTLVLPLPFPQA